MIRNVWSVARRDFRSYFTSPIAYILIAAFLFIMGWMFFNLLGFYLQQQMGFTRFGKGPSLNDAIVRPLYGNMNVVFLFITPFVTMRLFAEEKKNHTMELLLTSPLRLSEIVLGKFLSSLALVSIMLAVTLVYPATLLLNGNPDPGPLLLSYAGTLLLTSCYLALGMLFSALTENQIVAGALTFAAGLFFWLISWASQSAGPVLGEVLTYLSLIAHYNNFSEGLLNSSDILFYVSFVFTGLFLTHRALDSYRWR